jgi:hypothetical protein
LFGSKEPPFGGRASKKLFETKTLVLVFKVDFNPKPWFGVEKLLNDNVYILEERGFLDTPPFGGRASKKLWNSKIFIFWRKGVSWIPPPEGGGHPKN